MIPSTTANLHQSDREELKTLATVEVTDEGLHIQYIMLQRSMNSNNTKERKMSPR